MGCVGGVILPYSACQKAKVKVMPSQILAEPGTAEKV